MKNMKVHKGSFLVWLDKFVAGWRCQKPSETVEKLCGFPHKSVFKCRVGIKGECHLLTVKHECHSPTLLKGLKLVWM